MSYSNPSTPTIATPVGLDIQIQKIQTALSTLPWMEKAFGRAFRGFTEQEGSNQRILVPEVFQGAGLDFLKVFPNDNCKSFSFIYPELQESVDDYQKKSQQLSRNVAVIIFVNFDKIDTALGYRFTEALKADVLLKLSNPGIRFTPTGFTDDVEQAYREFTVSRIEAKYLQRKFGAMRFDGVVAYQNDECTLNTFTP